jgi:AcrR family transcriptional regulator
MISRERILEAAARVYAKHGFRGATTRLIAIEAGVNEVTLFRTFGSKGALIEAVLAHYHSSAPATELTGATADPASELTSWIHENLTRVRAIRPLLIHSMGEMEERPEAAEFACRGRHIVHNMITRFVDTLKTRGVADSQADSETAAVMLTGTVMSDAIARSFVPDVYPPESEAAERYAKCFLQMIGVKKTAASSVRRARARAS